MSNSPCLYSVCWLSRITEAVFFIVLIISSINWTPPWWSSLPWSVLEISSSSLTSAPLSWALLPQDFSTFLASVSVSASRIGLFMIISNSFKISLISQPSVSNLLHIVANAFGLSESFSMDKIIFLRAPLVTFIFCSFSSWRLVSSWYDKLIINSVYLWSRSCLSHCGTFSIPVLTWGYSSLSRSPLTNPSLLLLSWYQVELKSSEVGAAQTSQREEAELTADSLLARLNLLGSGGRRKLILAESHNDWDLLTLFLSPSVSPSQPAWLDHSSYLDTSCQLTLSHPLVPRVPRVPLPDRLCWRTEIHPPKDGSGSVLDVRVPHSLISSQDHPLVFFTLRKLTIIPPDPVSCLTLSVQYNSSALYNN